MKTRIALIALIIINASAIHAQTIMNIHQSNGTVLQIPLNTIDSITYTINNPGGLPTVETSPVTSITLTTANSGGNYNNNGGSIITQSGVCYDTNPSPTTANTIVLGSGSDGFGCLLTGLTPSTTYYVRAFAINSAGTSYGNEVSFTTIALLNLSAPGAGVTFDGYSYSSVVLDNGQEWISENLRTTIYANGDPIPNVTDNLQWVNLNTGAWAYYDNNIAYENPYGKLYNWYAVADPRNVCPAGWHVPSDSEWSTFINYIDTNADGGNNIPNYAGGRMKSNGTQYWLDPNQDATNESGFSGLPGGFRMGLFINVGVYGYWWSSSENNPNGQGLHRVLSWSDGSVSRSSQNKDRGLSVRCLKD